MSRTASEESALVDAQEMNVSMNQRTEPKLNVKEIPTTGIVVLTNQQRFKYTLAFAKWDASSVEVYAIKERASIKAFCDRFARVTIKSLEVEVVPRGRSLTKAAEVYMAWLPASVSNPTGHDDLMSYANSEQVSFGGPTITGFRPKLVCDFSNGIQPVIKAPLEFATTPKLCIMAWGTEVTRSVTLATATTPAVETTALAQTAADSGLANFYIRGVLEYEGAFASRW